MFTRALTGLGRSPSLRAAACTLPLAAVGAFLGVGLTQRAPAEAAAPEAVEARAWEEPPRIGCGALSSNGDVDTTCSLGVKWEYIGDAEATNNLGPREMSYFRGSDGSLKVVSRAKDPNAPIQVQVGIQPAGEARYTRITQRLSGGGMRLFDSFRYQESGAYSMTVHDLTGRESWTRMVNDYKEDGQTLRRSISYLRDGTINISAD